MVALNRTQGRAANDGGAFPYPAEQVDARLLERLRRACDPFSTIDVEEHVPPRRRVGDQGKAHTVQQIREADRMTIASIRQRFYFTFGLSHHFADRYVVIDATSADAARDEMFRRFGREWGFQYDEASWVRDGVSQADQYNLTELR